MTVNELALSLIKENDEASDNTEFVSMVEVWVQDALDEFASSTNFKLFKKQVVFNTIVSTAIYSLDVNVREIRAMRFTGTNDPIDYVDEPRLYGIAENLEELGKPQFWFWADTTQTATPQYRFQLDPIPDSVYQIQMSVIFHPTLTPLTSANIPLQQEMIIALKHRVRSYIYANDKELDTSAFYLSQYQAIVQRFVDREKTPAANYARRQIRDIGNQTNRKLARLDPSHFGG